MFMFAMLALAGVGLLVLAVLSLRKRVEELTEEVERLRESGTERLQDLTRRVWLLEKHPVPVAPESQPPPPEPVVPAVEVVEPAIPPLPEPTVAAPAIPQEDWESRLGGNWLNRLGVLVLVIGIALFLGYSLTNMGPAARVTVCFAVSVSMLTAGVALERKPRYRTFGYGLVGGGWAGVYLTTFAMHAVDAARVIDSPVIGMALLIVVAAGMIGHSLAYKSQVVTGMAYGVAFVTLAIGPAAQLARIASVPLAVSALYVAWRFSWNTIALAGVLMSYGSYVVRTDPDPPMYAGWIAGRPIPWIFWLVFEAYDLVIWHRPGARNYALLAMNLVGLLAATFLGRPTLPEDQVDRFLPLAAAACLASAVLRRWLGQAKSPEERDLGFEWTSTAAALLAAWALVRRFDDAGLALALGIEAEMIVLAGFALGSPYLRILGTIAMAVPCVLAAFLLYATAETVKFWGITLDTATPVALALAAGCAVNRVMFGRPGPVWSRSHSYAASVLVGLVLASELAPAHLAWAFVAGGIALLEIRAKTGLEEFRWQGAFFALLAIVALAGQSEIPRSRAWYGLGVPAVLAYAAAVRHGRLGTDIRAAGVAVTLGNAFLTTFLWRVLPSTWVAPAWGALALALTAAGVRLGRIELRVQGYLLALSTFLRVWINFDATGDWWMRLAPSCLAAAMFFALGGLLPRQTDAKDRGARSAAMVLACVLAAAIVLDEVAGRLLTVAWGVESIIILGAGIAVQERALRLSGLALFLVCVAKAFIYDLSELDTLSRIFSFVVLGLMLVGASWIYTRFRERIRRYL